MRTFLSLALLSVIGASGVDPPMEDRELNTDLTVSQRSGMRDSNRPWLLYYKFTSEFGNDRKAYIKGAMKIVEDVSCLRFVEVCGRQRSLLDIRKNRCDIEYSYTGSMTTLSVPDNFGCLTTRPLMRNLFNALDCVHKSLSYRPVIIKYVTGNILAGSAYPFTNYSKDIVEDFGAEYDNGSIMHSPATYNADSGEETIVSLKKIPIVLMDQFGTLSKSNIISLNKMYNCSMD